MKTNEEKLKVLLLKAMENGWVGYIYSKCLNKALCSNNINLYNQPNMLELRNEEGVYSLNDLVTNWEEGEVSFIEALCETAWDTNLFEEFGVSRPKFSDEENSCIKLLTSKIREGWLIPTSQRLDYLFKTFNHLLE